MSTCQCCGSKYNCTCTVAEIQNFENLRSIKNILQSNTLQSQLSTRNYWRRLIAACMSSDADSLTTRIVNEATFLVNELEVLEAIEAKEIE